MEHACPSCGKMVEDGTPFCECGEPQIHVSVPSPYEPAPGAAEPQPEGQRPSPAVDLSEFNLTRTGGVVWSKAWMSAAMGGVLAFFLFRIAPVPAFLLLCMVAGGGVAVTLYRRRVHAPFLSTGQGFRIGAVAGLFSFAVMGVEALVGFMAQPKGSLSKTMQQTLQQAAQQSSASADPAAQQRVQDVIKMAGTPDGAAALLGLMLLLMFILFVVLSGAGGALSARLFGGSQSRH